ncbi:MAG: TIGR02266 family protein [Nitrospira sp.]|nr:TIGR02266 family protein [Nitrospira sp.]
MRYSVASSLRHRGKALELDPAREMVILIGNDGEPIGSLSWDFVIDQIMACRKTPVPTETRSEPRVSITLRVRYRTPEGQHFESRASGIGGGGMFIESHSPLPIGTRLAMEFLLPDNPEEWLPAKGVVAWVCPKADHYTFSPGMGVQFTEVAPDIRERVRDVVKAVRRKGESSEALLPA